MHTMNSGGRQHRITRHGRRRTTVSVGLVGLAVGAMVAMTGTAQAATAFQDGGFELGTYSTAGWDTLFSPSTAMTGWDVTSGSVDWVGSYWAAQALSRSVDLDGNAQGAIAQTFSTVTGATYMVQFYLAGNPDGAPATKSLNVSATGTPTMTYTFDATGMTHLAMGWTAEAYEFTATSDTTTLTFASGTSGAYGPVVDSVSVTRIVTSGSECKDGGWQGIIDPDTGAPYKNQGQCVSHFAVSGDTPIGS